MIPIEFKSVIENICNDININSMRETSKNITKNYKDISIREKSFISSTIDVATYLAVRFPATYSAVYASLEKTFELFNDEIKTVVDIGSGVGTATLALNSLLPNNISFDLVERENEMIDVGKKIFKDNLFGNEYSFIKADYQSYDFNKQYDLVISSYSLNELKPENRITVVDKLWNVTNKLLIIVEPGTIEGFKELQVIKEYLVNNGGFVVAPCTSSSGKCFIDKNDWCNFSVRVQRWKIHKAVKDVDVPYEDEKFCYLAVSKTMVEPAKERILRHPIINKGNVSLKLCTEDGIKNRIVTKSEKDEYKVARKIGAGDKM